MIGAVFFFVVHLSKRWKLEKVSAMSIRSAKLGPAVDAGEI